MYTHLLGNVAMRACPLPPPTRALVTPAEPFRGSFAFCREGGEHRDVQSQNRQEPRDLVPHSHGHSHGCILLQSKLQASAWAGPAESPREEGETKAPQKKEKATDMHAARGKAVWER